MTATLECADVAKKTTGEKQPKRYGVMVRVTDEFAAALRDATGVEHMSAAEFCDAYLLPVVRKHYKAAILKRAKGFEEGGSK